MISIENDDLVFRFPGVHADAMLSVSFMRTLRLPDDGKRHFLPPGLGRFPLRHTDDGGHRLPQRWRERGGVMLPMHQNEAMWLNFSGDYPMAIKIAAGKINALTGDAWQEPLQRNPQDYMVTPEQPWLDGFCVERGEVRQFVAAPLGAGQTAEEQLTGAAEHGGLQILVHPMRPELYCPPQYEMRLCEPLPELCCETTAEMGLAPGARLRQEIYADPYGANTWLSNAALKCFVSIAHATHWQMLTGESAPPEPKSPNDYAGPYFEYVDNGNEPLAGAWKLKTLKGI